MDQKAPERVQPEKDNGGVWVSFGQKEYLAPPLNFRALREVMPLIKRLPSTMGGSIPLSEFSEEHVRTICTIIHAALKRNYPSLTIEDIEEMLDLGNAMSVVTGVLNTSGFVQGHQRPGEA